MHTSETLSPWRPFQLNLFYMWLCFRLYPLATMNCRILSEDIVLDGYLIPKEVKLHKWPKQVEIFVEMLLPVKSRPALRRCGVFPYLLSFFTSTDYRTICQYNKISRNVFWITSKINRLLSVVHNLCSVYSKFYENPPMTFWVILLTDKQRAIITVPPLKAVLLLLCVAWWCNGSLACDSRGRELNSRPFRCQVTTLGKLFTHMCLSHQAV